MHVVCRKRSQIFTSWGAMVTVVILVVIINDVMIVIVVILILIGANAHYSVQQSFPHMAHLCVLRTGTHHDGNAALSMAAPPLA